MVEAIQTGKECTKYSLVAPEKIMKKVMFYFEDVQNKEPRVNLDITQTITITPFTLKTTAHSEDGLDRRVNVLTHKKNILIITRERTIDNNNETIGTRYSILKKKEDSNDPHMFIKLQCTEEGEQHIEDNIVSGKSGPLESFTISELLSISQFMEL
jgi:hypothetical protein